MPIQHSDIPNDGIHEPKGAVSAQSGQVYVANGTGSGMWQGVPNNPDNMFIERILDGISLASSQEPVSTDTPIQMEFGAAINDVTDPAMLAADGTLTINQAGTYRIKISVAYGRTGGAGTSELYFRALVNGVQAGQSVHAKVGAADVYTPYTDEAWLTLPAGTVIKYEIMRDSSGNDSGGLFSGSPTPGDWNDNPSAAIRVERWASL